MMDDESIQKEMLLRALEEDAKEGKGKFLKMLNDLALCHRDTEDDSLTFPFIMGWFIRAAAVSTEEAGSTREKFMDVCEAAWHYATVWKISKDEDPNSFSIAVRKMDKAIEAWNLKEKGTNHEPRTNH